MIQVGAHPLLLLASTEQFQSQSSAAWMRRRVGDGVGGGSERPSPHRCRTCRASVLACAHVYFVFVAAASAYGEGFVRGSFVEFEDIIA